MADMYFNALYLTTQIVHIYMCDVLIQQTIFGGLKGKNCVDCELPPKWNILQEWVHEGHLR